MKSIHLHGALAAQFAPVYALDVTSPAEAIRAPSTMVRGFRQALMKDDGFFQVFTGNRSDDAALELEQIAFKTDADTIHIAPVVEGAKSGFGKILLGGLLIAASFAIPGAGLFGAGIITSSTVAGVGVSLALGGLSQILAPTPSNNFDDREPQRRSNLFGAGVNVATPGAAIPIIIGECEVGSVEISAAIHLEDVDPEDDDSD